MAVMFQKNVGLLLSGGLADSLWRDGLCRVRAAGPGDVGAGVARRHPDSCRAGSGYPWRLRASAPEQRWPVDVMSRAGVCAGQRLALADHVRLIAVAALRRDLGAAQRRLLRINCEHRWTRTMRAMCLARRPTCSRNCRSRCRRVMPTCLRELFDRDVARGVARSCASARSTSRSECAIDRRAARRERPRKMFDRRSWPSSRRSSSSRSAPLQHARRGNQLILQLPHRRAQRRAGAAGPEADADQIDIAGRQGDVGRVIWPASRSTRLRVRLPSARLHERIGEVEDDLDATVRHDRLGDVELAFRAARKPDRLDRVRERRRRRVIGKFHELSQIRRACRCPEDVAFLTIQPRAAASILWRIREVA